MIFTKMSTATRAELMVEIKRNFAEHETKGIQLEREIQELYKQHNSTEVSPVEKRLRKVKQQCRQEDAESVRLIGKIRAALE